MNFSQLPEPRAEAIAMPVRTDIASPEQVTLCKEAIYGQLEESGYKLSMRGFADVYYGILLTLADHGSSKRLSAHPDVVMTVENILEIRPTRSADSDGASSSGAAVMIYGNVLVRYQMARLGDAILVAGIKSVRRFARAEANRIYQLIQQRGFSGEMTQWHVKSRMPRDLWQWAFDVADYVTVAEPDEREKVAIAASRQAIRATEEIVNYGTQTTFRSGQ